MRRGELIAVDLEDINWVERSIKIKPDIFHKRSYLKVYFDEETATILNQWLNRQKVLAALSERALFVSDFGTRFMRSGVYNGVIRWATLLGKHDSTTTDFSKKFSPHNLRHEYTTILQQNNMPRKHLQMLRGDSSNEVVDLYSHPSDEELRRSYLSCMSKIGIY